MALDIFDQESVIFIASQKMIDSSTHHYTEMQWALIDGRSSQWVSKIGLCLALVYEIKE